MAQSMIDQLYNGAPMPPTPLQHAATPAQTGPMEASRAPKRDKIHRVVGWAPAASAALAHVSPLAYAQPAFLHDLPEQPQSSGWALAHVSPLASAQPLPLHELHEPSSGWGALHVQPRECCVLRGRHSQVRGTAELDDGSDDDDDENNEGGRRGVKRRRRNPGSIRVRWSDELQQWYVVAPGRRKA